MLLRGPELASSQHQLVHGLVVDANDGESDFRVLERRVEGEHPEGALVVVAEQRSGYQRVAVDVGQP